MQTSLFVVGFATQDSLGLHSALGAAAPPLQTATSSAPPPTGWGTPVHAVGGLTG